VGNHVDFKFRGYDPRTGRFGSVDPVASQYPWNAPYNFAEDRVIDGKDLEGLEWKGMTGGFMWDPTNAFSDQARTKLKVGYYKQAIYFSDEGTFNDEKEFNMGTSTATVYKANGSTTTFDASIYPARLDEYATTPEGDYEATVGMHHGKYEALHVHDVGKTGSESIDLGVPNPSNPSTTTATGIHIHKAGINNKTGLTSKGQPISAGCLLIDYNKWNSFISIFNNANQRNNVIGVQVSRNSAAGQAAYCGSNPNVKPVTGSITPGGQVNVNPSNSNPWGN
jgi:hypothetical protein